MSFLGEKEAKRLFNEVSFYNELNIEKHQKHLKDMQEVIALK